MWFLADVIGLFSVNQGSFSFNVVQSASIFSANVVPKTDVIGSCDLCNRAATVKRLKPTESLRWVLGQTPQPQTKSLRKLPVAGFGCDIRCAGWCLSRKLS